MSCSFQKKKMIQEKGIKQQLKDLHTKLALNDLVISNYRLYLLFAAIVMFHFVFSKDIVTRSRKENTEGKKIKINHDATRSGVSASMDNKAVCTLPNQLSSRSRKDLIWGIPKTLGCTQDTCTVPSTWSIIPSMRWTCGNIIPFFKSLKAQTSKTIDCT